MKRFLFILLIVLLSISGNAKKFKTIKPKKYLKTVMLQFEKNKLKYYITDNKNKIELDIKGPTTLKVYVRGVFEKSFKKKTVKFKYSKDGVVKTVSRYLERDKKEKSKDFVTKSAYVTINIPKGYHKLKFWADDKYAGKAVLKFRKELKKKIKVKKTYMTPKNKVETVELVYNESILSYSRITSDNAAELVIKGPTTIEVINRLEFDIYKKGTQSFNVIVMEDGVTKNTYSLTSTASDVTTYKSEKDKKVGKGKTFEIKVPEGIHLYRFLSGNKDKTILQRYRIPAKDIKR